MATATEVREWAVGEGLARGRGQLARPVIDRWDADHPDDPYVSGPPRDGFTGNAPDYPDADFDENFPEPDPLGDTGETPPRRPKSSKKTPAGLRGRFGRKAKPGTRKKTVPR